MRRTFRYILACVLFRPPGRWSGILGVLIWTSSIFGSISYLALHKRSTFWTEIDPTGKYIATCSYRTYLSMLPTFPGQGRDKPCFVKITDIQGRNFGEIPVPMLQLAELEWQAQGAEIKLIGEWDFAHRTCYYWSEDQNHKIYRWLWNWPPWGQIPPEEE